MANHFTAASRLLLLPAILSLASCQRVDPQAPETSPLPEIITTAGGIEMVRIPAGRFTMGDDRDEDDQSPTHDVQIDAFLLDRYEVTQQHYVPMMLDSGSNFKGPNRPVEMVSWIKAASYCNARSEEEGLEPCYREDLTCDFEADGYRLPTEAEWEYA
ncbi:MAG: formylglycine-generating enzyme family protein, partial [Candidatus Nealsonbacteria bacterium]|nr:formylglycine-generating enzyme family protein [Candidatus Nealsonbacteria bacterium]